MRCGDGGTKMRTDQGSRSTMGMLHAYHCRKNACIMKSFKTRLCIALILLFTLPPSLSKAQIDIKIHYLGHASFLMDFIDFTAVTDFGTSNCWGYNSPIYGFGDLIPTIMSFSHYHDDHYDPESQPAGVPYILDMTDTLSLMNLFVTPVRTCETTPGVESNTSFTYNYNGYRILHLGDAQAEIMNIADPAQQALILEKFPKPIDLLLMTIEGVQQFIPEAEMFIDLLQPGMVIPMHYWSPEYKEEFLDYLELQNDTAGKSYLVIRHEGPLLTVNSGDTVHGDIIVYGLTPFPYGETGMNGKQAGMKPGVTAYPLPCHDRITIEISCRQAMKINIAVINPAGAGTAIAATEYIVPGENSFSLDTSGLRPGIYLVVVENDAFRIKKKIVVH